MSHDPVTFISPGTAGFINARADGSNVREDDNDADDANARIERMWLAGHGYAWDQVWAILDYLNLSQQIEAFWLTHGG